MNTYAEDNHYDTLSKFESLKEFNSHFEQAMSLHKSNFTKGEYVALNKLRKFAGSSVVGVAWCKIQKAVAATHQDELFGVSRRTFDRMLSKAKKLNLIQVIHQVRKNNWQKHNVFVFNRLEELFIEPKDKVQIVSEYASIGAPEVLTIDAALTNSPIKLNNNNTNTTGVSEMFLIKEGLINKLPAVLASIIKPFFSDSNELYEIAGTIFKAKAKIDKSVRIEDHEFLYRKAILGVFESWKRNKIDNLSAVMYKAICETTESIISDKTYEIKNETVNSKSSKELIPRWMIDTEIDPSRKIELEIRRNMTLSQKQSSEDLFKYANAHSGTSDKIDFEVERVAILAKLGYKYG